MPELRYAPVTAVTELTGSAILLEVKWEHPEAKPGQFYMLGAEGKQLPRPISLCDVTSDGLVFCIDAVGEGTKKLKSLRPGDMLPVTGPLGNGFDVDELNRYKRVALVSGGAGIAPMVYLSKRLTCEMDSFCGFADMPYLTEKLPNACVSTDSGRFGRKGLVTELLDVSRYDMVAACGPGGMLRAVGKLCADAHVPCLLSMEQYMACGVGACLVCTCETKHGYKRCCADGPVFRGEELNL